MLRWVLFITGMVSGVSVFARDSLNQANKAIESGLAATRVVEAVEVENLVNVDSVALEPGGDPYQSQLVYVTPTVDKATGAMVVQTRVGKDQRTPYRLEHNPAHPGADTETGILKKPNVQREVVMANLKENAIQAAALAQAAKNIKFMHHQTLDLLKGN